MSYSIDEFNEESIKLTRAINALLARLVREKQDPNEKITSHTLASMAATLERTQRIGRLALIRPKELIQTEMDLSNTELIKIQFIESDGNGNEKSL